MNLTREKTTNKDGSKREGVAYGSRENGRMTLYFSDPGLELYADFDPPTLGNRPIGFTDVMDILEKSNVVYGICDDAIKEALEGSNRGRCRMRDVLIAKGDEPEPEIAESYELAPMFAKVGMKVDSKARIDHRERSPFIIVSKDQVLAQLKPRIPGKEGVNIYGTVIPFNTIRPEGVTGGNNTRTEEGKIVAGRHGQLIENRKIISVYENLVIKGGVGYRTGNIVFPGDVQIDGPVSDGFKIFSGGSIFLKETLDLCEVAAKGNISVNGGIIGKGPAFIKAGGGIRAKFIENCRILARNTVTVDNEIIHSSVYTLGTIDMGERGRIVGCDIYATRGLRTGGIGKDVGVSKPTHIHCGIDFTVQQEKEKHTSRLRIVSAKLERLRELMEKPDQNPEKLAQMKILLRRLEGEQQAASTRIAELLGNINADERAVVEVTGDVLPGTIIEICQVALFIDKPLQRVRFKLNNFGKLVSEKL
jgi:uncharacterized protein (DUF342 family)